MPVSSADRSCRRFTVGSSPYQSSPTSASYIARRIDSVGRVTVSDRRSMGRCTTGEYRWRMLVFDPGEKGRVPSMVIAILFMLLGAGVVLAGLQWRSGQWLESGRWVTRR